MFKNKILIACSFLALMSLVGCKQKIDFPGFGDDDPFNVGAKPRTSDEGTPEASDVDFSVEAPDMVPVDEPFYVKYELKDAEGSAFTSPDFGEDFIVVGGPSVSHSSSVQIINGHASSNSTTSYTFMVQATKEGEFEIPEATIQVEGQTVKSKKATINVGNGSDAANPQASAGNPQAGTGNSSNARSDEQNTSSSSSVAKDKLYFTVEATKRKVHEQEPIVLTYKVHSLANLGLANVMLKQKPDLKGFWSQEVKLSRNISSSPEQVGGKLYGVGTCLKYIVFPQKTGTLTVPSVAFECHVQRKLRNAMDPFDEFFGGGGSAPQIVQRATDAMDIEVLPLPNKPAGFSGGVGHFDINTQLMTPQPKTNDVVTMRVTVSGVGNLSLVKAPMIAFPSDFDTYDAKMTDKTQVTEQGITGSVIFDYTFVPQNVGKYDIPAAEFIYFDTEKEDYVTLRTDPIHLDVKKGERSREDVEAEMAMRNSDIHDVVLGDPSTVSTEGFGADATWIGSPLYFVCLLVLIGGLTLLTLFLRRRAARNADVAGARNRKARKAANKHLRAAEKALATGDHNAFYSALAQALRGYFADKLTRDAAALTNESILAALQERGLAEDVLAQTKTLLEDCDFARFAPAQEAAQREKDLQRASDLLNLIDQNIK